MYLDRVEDLEDALQALDELRSDEDSRNTINQFFDKRLDGVIYQIKQAIERIAELDDQLEAALERVNELETE